MSMIVYVGSKPYVIPAIKFCKVLMNHSSNDFDNPKVCQSVPRKQFPCQYKITYVNIRIHNIGYNHNFKNRNRYQNWLRVQSEPEPEPVMN
jgi:hypothetical protein